MGPCKTQEVCTLHVWALTFALRNMRSHQRVFVNSGLTAAAQGIKRRHSRRQTSWKSIATRVLQQEYGSLDQNGSGKVVRGVADFKGSAS